MSERSHPRRLAPHADQSDVSQLAAIYRARWAVEIQFRAWKQALNLGKALNRKSNEHHLQALVLAGMIAHQLGMRIAQRIGNMVGRARLSYEKLYDLLAVRLVRARALAEIAAFDPDPRHVARDKRTRKSPVESGILALTFPRMGRCLLFAMGGNFPRYFIGGGAIRLDL